RSYVYSSSTLSFSIYVAPRDLHSFPTRRSSDLVDDDRAEFLKRRDGFLDDGVGAGVLAHEIARDADARALERALLQKFRVVRLEDRKSTRLNSSHGSISYAVFCLKKKKIKDNTK